jgi:hypothetical protein
METSTLLIVIEIAATAALCWIIEWFCEWLDQFF